MNIYCIHENRPEYFDRKKFIEHQYNKLIPHPQKPLIWITSFPADFFSSENSSPYNRLHTVGKATEKSCFWKHYAALQQIAASGSVGLVLEDDAIFRPDLISKCEHLISHLADPYFYINLEYCSDDVPIYYVFHKMVKMKGTRRNGAYLVAPEAAARLVGLIDRWLAEEKTFDFLADGFITESYSTAGINTYWSVHPLVYQGSKTGRFSSDLSFRKYKSYYKFYEFMQYYCVPIINKIRACFLKKILIRVEYPIK